MRNMRWKNRVRGGVIIKEIILVGNKRAGVSNAEVSQAVRDTESVRFKCSN